MKKVVLTIIISVLGSLLLSGGAVFAGYMSYANTVSFDKYEVMNCISSGGRTPSEQDEIRAQKRIKYPSYVEARYSSIMPDLLMIAPELQQCYYEVDNAGHEYALLIAQKYDNNADLDFTVDISGNTLTIAFTGVGYPENGEPESLDRTYIFDIEGAGANRLPRLTNRAEFIGY